MKYKVLCSDLDGTLLSTKSDVSEFTISEIKRIKNTTRIILVSARMPSGMYYIQENLGISDQPIICYNGALVLDGNKEIHSVTIPLTIVRDIYKLTEPLKVDLGLYAHNDWHVPKTSERVEKEIKYTKTIPTFKSTQNSILEWEDKNVGAHKIMIMGTKETADILMPQLNTKFQQELNIYRSNDTLIEVSPKSVSKLSAIKSLLTDDETLNDVISLGDNYNDLEMLVNTACGVAVANGREEVKKSADFVTSHNTEDGVAQYIQQHLHI